MRPPPPPAARAFAVHAVLPSAVRQNGLLSVVRPNTSPSFTTGVLNFADAPELLHNSFVLNSSPDFSTLTAFVPRPTPEKITVSPSTIGVEALYCMRPAENGVFHNTLPSARLTPIMFWPVSATIILVLSAVNSTGEAYSEPSEHFHFSLPSASS